MTLFVDTSVWSLAFRRDTPSGVPEVHALRHALESEETIVTTGLILQELLQGFAGPRAGKDIINRFAALPLLAPDRQDHIDAAELRNRCRRADRHHRCTARATLYSPRTDVADNRQRLCIGCHALPVAGLETVSLVNRRTAIDAQRQLLLG